MTEQLENIRAIDAATFSNESLRATAVQEVYSLLSRIESPYETAWRISMTFPNQFACLKVAVDLKLFNRWLDFNNGVASTFQEIAALVPECDPELLLRVLRVLSSTHVLWADSEGTYFMTPFAIGLVKEDMAGIIECCFEFVAPGSLHTPIFLAASNYRDPQGGENDNFKHYSGIGGWEYLAANPAVTANLGRYMKASGRFRGTFSAIYSPAAQLSGQEDEVLVVDVGGSVGHDLQAFKKAYPHAIGKLVLQDLPDVIKNATDLDPSIDKMGYDFFTEQPVKGARIYHFHSILHDWRDHDAKRILETLRPALKPNHSKLLIEEIVVPNIKPDITSSVADWVMMTLNSGRERTEEQWQSLISSAGFAITKIWRSPLYTEAIIECDLADVNDHSS